MKHLMSPRGIMLFVLVILSGCKHDLGANLIKAAPLELSFTRQPKDVPVLNSGISGEPSNPGDPYVLKDDDGYHLFVSNLFCQLTQKGADYYGLKVGAYYYSLDQATKSEFCADYIFTTAYAFSKDKGVTWKFRTSPVLLPDSGDAWDSGFNETPNVVVKDDKLYLFYSGLFKNDKNFRYQIGVASLDLHGKSIYQNLMKEEALFDRSGRTEPLIPRKSGGFEDNTQEPTVEFRNGRFEVYYTGLRRTDDGNVTGIALFRKLFDENFQELSSSKPILVDDPLRRDGNNINVNITEVRHFQGLLYLFYTTKKVEGGFQHQGEKIAFRTSTDEGETWSSEKILLEPRDGASFDNWGIMAPSVVLDEINFICFFPLGGQMAIHAPAVRTGGETNTKGDVFISPWEGRSKIHEFEAREVAHLNFLNISV